MKQQWRRNQNLNMKALNCLDQVASLSMNRDLGQPWPVGPTDISFKKWLESGNSGDAQGTMPQATTGAREVSTDPGNQTTGTP